MHGPQPTVLDGMHFAHGALNWTEPSMLGGYAELMFFLLTNMLPVTDARG